MLGSMGIETGIDIDRLLALRARVAGWLAGETLHGALWQAGLPRTFGLRPPCRLNITARRHPMTTAAPPLPLAGVRVLEFTHMVMGPTCGMILADLGAEVIKVEPPGGDKTRKLPGLGIGFFRSLQPQQEERGDRHRHRRRPAPRALELIGQCDVVLENFRPGLMAKLRPRLRRRCRRSTRA